ncbi:MAG: transcriptional regulator [Bacteroidia bacterium]|nr:MAG: transcriptional regulator [Bacteroidia bacterium]
MDTLNLKNLLLTLIAQKECEWIEFKVNNSNPEEIGEYISALSNSACYHQKENAYLVFGIDDKGNKVGTTFYPRDAKIGNQELENWLVTQLYPRIDVNILEYDEPNLHFVIFQIQPATNQPVRFKGVSYIRIGSYKKKLSEHPERERTIWQQPETLSFENGFSITNLSEADVLNYLDYPKLFDLLGLPLPAHRQGIIDKLSQEKIIQSRGANLYSISNIGAVLFAKDIEKFENIARKAIRLIFYDGKNRVKTKKEITGKKGYAVGFEGLINYLEENLPSNEVIEKALRKQVPVYPLLALRELIANALIHQDFTIRGSSPMIEIFENRIEITNPGKPLIDPLRFIDHNPQSRNEKLARMMRRLNICEERGSGIDKVVFECEKYQLPAPEFIVGDNYTRVILYAHKTLRQMDKEDKIRACYQHACLKYVSGEYMTNQSVRERFGIEEQNYSIASRIIAETIQAGLVKEYDSENKSRKYAKYVPFWG